MLDLTPSATPLGSPVIRRSCLRVLSQFDQGGDGRIFEVDSPFPNRGLRLLYKEYRDGRLDQVDRDALNAFPAFIRALPGPKAAWLYGHMAWPCWVVDAHDESGPNDTAGILMPKAPDRFIAEIRTPSRSRKRVPAKFELLLNGDPFLQDIGVPLSPRQGLELLAEVADTLTFLHANGLVVGDFSCKNILFTLEPKPGCFFVDCDSMSLDGRSPMRSGQTPEWELPPGEDFGSANGDLYKFALLVLRMHTGAQHHRSSSRLPDHTSAPIRQLLAASLVGPPLSRPLITEWAGPLRQAALNAPSAPRATRSTSHSMSGGAWRSEPGSPHLGTLEPSATDPSITSDRYGTPVLDRVASHPLGASAVSVVRWLVCRRSATPSFLKMITMLAGLWLACGLVFALAWAAGLDPQHLDRPAQLLLFGIFAALAFVAFGLATTEPE